MDVQRVALENREANGAAAESNTLMRRRVDLVLIERGQKGENNSLGGNVCLNIGRRFTEMHMVRKGQVKRLDERDAVGQAKFVVSLFGVAT
jgi:hypothetical protein